MTKDVFVALSDEELLKFISERNELAFEVLYNRYQRKIYTFALKVLKHEERAEDVVHEIFLRLWQHSQPAQINNLEAYLRIATRNYSLKVLRRLIVEENTAERILNTQMGRQLSDIEEQIFFKEIDGRYREVLSKMPSQQQKVYILCKEEGLKYEEVAEKMAISKLTVKTHMQHALRFMRSNLIKYTGTVLILILLKSFF